MPTPAPDAVPTVVPTADPSPAPSSTPTAVPTAAPSGPTVTPSRVPTPLPTEATLDVGQVVVSCTLSQGGGGLTQTLLVDLNLNGEGNHRLSALRGST